MNFPKYTFIAIGALLLNAANVHAKNPCASGKINEPFDDSSIGRNYPVYPMGIAKPDHTRRSPRFGILYHSNGIEFGNHCIKNYRVAAIERYITEKRLTGLLTPEVENDFRLQATALVSDPNAVGKIIDKCFADISQKWKKCGRRYDDTAREMFRMRSQLRVQIMPTAFWVTGSTGGNLWAAGMASTDKISIFARSTALKIGGNQQYFVHTLESLVCWELGNNFAMNHGRWAHSLESELGFQVPCEFFRK